MSQAPKQAPSNATFKVKLAHSQAQAPETALYLGPRPQTIMKHNVHSYCKPSLFDIVRE